MTSYWRRRSVHWRPLQGLLGCLGPNPATTDCIMWQRLFVLVNVCPRALRHFLDDILLLEALTGRVFRTAGVGFKRPPCISLFRGFFVLIIQFYVLSQCAVFLDVIVFLGLLGSWYSCSPSIVCAARGAFFFCAICASPLLLCVYLYLVLFSCCNLVYILYL